MHRRRRLRIALAMALVVGVLAPATPVLAAPALNVTPSSGVVGATLTANATGFTPNGPVTFWWDNLSLLAVVTASGSGAATLEFKIPAGASLGEHFVRACDGSSCLGGPFPPYADDTVTVVAKATPRPTRAPTPRPTAKPTPRPTRTPGPSAMPTLGPSLPPTLGPSPTSPGLPNPSFPLSGPSATPTLPAYVAITPAPQPPGNVTVPETEWPNLWVDGIEVTQGIQNLDNDMPLVAGRRTYARVYVDLDGADSWPHTWGALEARRGAQQLGWIWPDNGPITARDGGGERTELDDSLYFRLPASWLSSTVTLTAFVFSYGINTPFTHEPVSADNTRQASVYFDEGLPLTIHLAPLHMHRSWHPSDVERTFFVPNLGGVITPGTDLSGIGVTNRVVAGALRYLPIAGVNVDSLNSAVTPLNHFNGHEFDLGGPCRTVLTESADANHVALADWTVLMKDPSEVTPGGGSVTPDRDELRIMDWTFTADYFYAREDGTADVFGSTDYEGPTPVAGAPVYAYGCSMIVDEDSEPNHVVGLYRVFYDWADEREMFVGMVHPSLRAQWGGFSTSSTDSVWVRWLDQYGEDDPWRHRGASILGHESAHFAGLNHVPCKDDNDDGIPDEVIGGDFDLTHPMTLTFPDCWLSEVDPEGYFGFDTYWDRFALQGPTVISNDPAFPLPNRAFPLLSYDLPAWIDPYHYCRLLSYYGVTCSPTELDLPWNVPPPQPDGSDPFAAVTPPPAPLGDGIDTMTITFTGLEDGTWTMEALARNPDPTQNDAERIAAARRVPPDEDIPWLVVLDADGAVEWQAMLPLGSRPHEAEGGMVVGDAVVPIGPRSSAVEIRGWDAQVKARITGSAGVPEIAGLFKDTADGETVEPDDQVLVSFEGGDPDPDSRIRYFLLYSPDRERWQLVGATEGGEVPAPARDLPSGEDPAFRLVAFDGWNVADEILPAPELAAPRNGPTVLILASEPRRYPLQALVRLEASAFDLEDRALSGDAIRWSSSLDGDLGTGGELSTRALSAGRHVLTATATDSDGLEGSATYELEVDGSVIEPVPGAEMDAAMARIFERLGAGLDPAPSVDDHPDFAWLPIGIATALLVLVAAGGWLLRARATRPAAATPSGGWTPITGDWDGDASASPDDPPKEKITIHGQQDADPATAASSPKSFQIISAGPDSPPPHEATHVAQQGAEGVEHEDDWETRT